MLSPPLKDYRCLIALIRGIQSSQTQKQVEGWLPGGGEKKEFNGYRVLDLQHEKILAHCFTAV